MPKIDILNSETFAQKVTERLAETLKNRDAGSPFHLFLSGGSTPKVVYAGLAEESIDWEGVHLWWGDERFVPADHPDSNFRMVSEQLLQKVEIPSLQIHPWPILSTPELSASTYDREFRDFFVDGDQSVNLQLLGMGDDGHTASLFPGTEALEERELMCLANNVEGKDSVRLTLTYPALAKSVRTLFLVKGSGKAQAVYEVLEKDMHPASKVASLAGTEFWLDTEAASKIQAKKN